MTFVASARRLARELNRQADRAEAHPVGRTLRRDPTLEIVSETRALVEVFLESLEAWESRARKVD
jgi:hypothetical protein